MGAFFLSFVFAWELRLRAIQGKTRGRDETGWTRGLACEQTIPKSEVFFQRGADRGSYGGGGYFFLQRPTSSFPFFSPGSCHPRQDAWQGRDWTCAERLGMRTHPKPGVEGAFFFSFVGAENWGHPRQDAWQRPGEPSGSACEQTLCQNLKLIPKKCEDGPAQDPSRTWGSKPGPCFFSASPVFHRELGLSSNEGPLK